MCGPSDVVRGATDVATFGTAEIANKVSGNRIFGSGGFGKTNLLGLGGGNGSNGDSPTQLGSPAQVTPAQIAPQDPLQFLTQSGAAPLLSNVAMGVNPKTAIAGYFGQSGASYDSWYKGLSQDDKNSVDSLSEQLGQIQSNTQMRQAAVDKVIQDFPNIAQASLEKQKAAYASAASDFDAADKASLDRASSQLAAKYSASGGFSSGAFNAGLARTAADTAERRASLVYGSDKELADTGAAYDMEAASLRLGEVNALNSFQQKMLGQGATEGFSAARAALDRTQRTKEFNADSTSSAGRFNANAANEFALKNAGFANDQNMYNQKQNNAMYGALGSLAGFGVGSLLGGPAGGKVGATVGKAAVDSSMAGA